MSLLRGRAGEARSWLKLAGTLRFLPPRVAWFYARCWRHAVKTDDRFSLASAARPRELAELIRLARGRQAVVELGTGSAWTAGALAIDDRQRQVVTYDPVHQGRRDAYLGIAGAAAGRIALRSNPDYDGPQAGDPPVQLLFIDSAHEREAVLTAFGAWREALADDAVVVFHDYDHPEYPGVREAVGELGLDGRSLQGLYVWECAGRSVDAARFI